MEALGEHAVTQYVLHKHHLLNSFKAESVLQVVNDIVALHATSAETPYISLFARMKNFQRKHLDEEFYVRRNLVRLSAMRSTLFIISIELAPMLYQATKISESHLLRWIRRWGILPSEYQELAQKLHAALEGGGKTLSEIKKDVPKRMVRSLELRVGKSIYRMTNVNVVLNAMMSRGIVVSEKKSEKLRITEANRYLLLRETYPKLSLDSVESEEAKELLVKCYIRAFGPVTEEDVAWWTGFSKTDSKKALETIEKELHSVEISGLKADYLMLEKDFEQFVKFKPLRTRSVLLLPYEDPYTKGYKIRDRLIDKELEKRAYVGGSVQPTILINGKVAGTWNLNIDKRKQLIKLEFFLQPATDVKREAVQKAKAIGKLMTNREVNVEID